MSGPDFLNAVLKIGDEVYQGAVEIHKNSYDWVQHGHHENRQFNSVVLHVVYSHNGHYPYTISESGEKIEILEIKDKLDQDINKLLFRYENKSLYQNKKECAFFSRDRDSVISSLEQLGLERFERKIRRFAAELFFSDFDQLFYAGLLEALGYSKNKLPFYTLAQKMPLSLMKQAFQQGMTKDQMTAIFLISSGLIEKLPPFIPAEMRNKWISLFSGQDFFKTMLNQEWDTFRNRPGNHPAIRLLQVMDFIFLGLGSSPFRSLINCFSDEKVMGKNSLISERILNILKGDSLILPEKFRLGKERSDIIIVNIVLPLTVLYARKMNFRALETLAYQTYTSFKGLSDNFINSYLGTFMASETITEINKRSLLQQGCIQLYANFCIRHECNLCLESAETGKNKNCNQ